MSNKLTGYELSRKWFDFCFENPDKINPNQTALYFFAIEWCNRLGWKTKFGLPTSITMEAIGIKSYNSYKKTLTALIDFGFIEMVECSKNQYTSNIIALSNFDKAIDKALDNALMKHVPKQGESTYQSNNSINKLSTNNEEQLNISDLPEINITFKLFWDLYDKKKGPPQKIAVMWGRLSDAERVKAMEHIPKYKIERPDKQFRKDPQTYLNEKTFNDEIIKHNENGHSKQTGGSYKQNATSNYADRLFEEFKELE
ncbi:MAG: hypothetical protein ABI863_00495 [Ginsengibacter sp.]